MALVKLPASSLTALVGERELGIACGLGPPSPLFLFNSIWNQKAVDSGKWSCALYPIYPWSGPLFSIVLHPQAPLVQTGDQPPSLPVSLPKPL